MDDRVCARLRCEHLEDRLTPALTIQFDYRFDTSGFFSDPARRAALERAGQDLVSRITDTPLAIAPAGANAWSALFFNPATGLQTTLANLAVPQGAIVVFVAGRDFASGEAGEGGPGGYSVGGATAWRNTVAQRGMTGFSLWGGSVGFDTDVNWYFGSNPDGLTGQLTDFQTVATHELGHVLGFGASTAFNAHISGQYFHGPQTKAVNGGVAPRLSYDLSHFAIDTTYNSQPVSMQPYLLASHRYGFTDLDYAALDDIGWTINNATPTVPPVPPLPSPTPAAAAFTISGGTDGRYTVYSLPGNGLPLPIGLPVQPFPDFTGALRTALADVNGDGTLDVIAATGAGGVSLLRVLNGTGSSDLLTPLAVFGDSFTGGLFVATADFDNDGNADIVVSPDRGGGGRVSVFNLAAAEPRVGDFFGIDDAHFRGGARVAATDVSGDGTPDILVGAGFGGGPRVALFDGTTLGLSHPHKLIGDFFAFPGEAATALRNGVYIAAGDFTGDGRADLVFGAGPGGGPRVFILNGALVLAGRLDEARTAPLADFFAFNEIDRGGVQVTVKDIDNDAEPDLLVGSGTRKMAVHYRGATANWNGINPGNGVAFSPSNLFGDLEGVFVG